jgi:hypothetical protein
VPNTSSNSITSIQVKNLFDIFSSKKDFIDNYWNLGLHQRSTFNHFEEYNKEKLQLLLTENQ